MQGGGERRWSVKIALPGGYFASLSCAGCRFTVCSCISGVVWRGFRTWRHDTSDRLDSKVRWARKRTHARQSIHMAPTVAAWSNDFWMTMLVLRSSLILINASYTSDSTYSIAWILGFSPSIQLLSGDIKFSRDGRSRTDWLSTEYDTLVDKANARQLQSLLLRCKD